MIEKACLFCNVKFKADRQRTKCCSKQCANDLARKRQTGKRLIKRIEKTCIICSSLFEIMPHDKDKPIKYCSLKCAGRGKSKKFNHQPINRICRWCGNSFKVGKPSIKIACCSHVCSSAYRTEANEVERQMIIPEIKEYRKTHSSQKTSDRYQISEVTLRRWGILSENGYRREELLPYEFTQEQHETLIGNLLGDGSLNYIPEGSHRQSSFRLGQKRDFSEYVKGLQQIYQPLAIGYYEGQIPKPSTVNGKISHDPASWDGEYTYNSSLYTMAHPIFTAYRMKWYENPFAKSKKIIPSDLRLTWRSAAIWMCDDGSNYAKIRQRNLTLYTDCFTKQEVEFLIDVIRRDLGIIARISQRTDSQYIIRIYGEEWFKFIENIKPFIPWTCLKYKCVNREKISLNTSGRIGVSYHNQQKKWRAYGSNGQSSWSKTFHSKEEAIAAREKWDYNEKS